MQNLFDLSGKTALLTGSSQGVGFALARGLARAGARVVLNGRDVDRLDAAVSVLRSEGAAAFAAAFDVRDRAATAKAVAAVEAEHPIDILVNCAGVQHRAPLETFPEAQWRDLVSTNLDSVFFVSQAAAEGMLSRGAGKIINVCSVQSQLARPMIAPYAATKGAVKMLTKGMCADWGPRGIQVNALAPGYFATELTRALWESPEFDAWLVKRTPAGRWGQLEDLAGTCVYLAAAASNFVNGQIIYVDGGLTSVV